MEDNRPMEVKKISFIVCLFLPVYLLLCRSEDRPLFSRLMSIISFYCLVSLGYWQKRCSNYCPGGWINNIAITHHFLKDNTILVWMFFFVWSVVECFFFKTHCLDVFIVRRCGERKSDGKAVVFRLLVINCRHSRKWDKSRSYIAIVHRVIKRWLC